jgi:putative transposase
MQDVESNRDRENSKITKRIIQIHKERQQRYGAPKIHHLLQEEGFSISLKRVQRLMKKDDIRSIVKKKYRPYPSKERVVERENLLNQDFSTNTINEKWVADITYIHTLRDGWCYLASVMDLHTQKVVGYSFSRSMTTDIVVKALANACETQQPKNGLIIHTSLGTQSTSDNLKSTSSLKGSSNPSVVRDVLMTMHVLSQSLHFKERRSEPRPVSRLPFC